TGCRCPFGSCPGPCPLVKKLIQFRQRRGHALSPEAQPEVASLVSEQPARRKENTAGLDEVPAKLLDVPSQETGKCNRARHRPPPRKDVRPACEETVEEHKIPVDDPAAAPGNRLR